MKKQIILLLCILSGSLHAQAPHSIASSEFADPPAWSHVDTWWHWTDGNITRDGIRKDLESMHAAGIKRATILNVSGAPQYVPRVVFGSDRWLDCFRYALEVADSLGMQIGAHNCDGWSTSGGPWITPERSMKTYTWSSTYVSGGGSVDVTLARPTSFRGFFEDYAVVAVPSRRNSNSFLSAAPKISLRGEDVSALLCDANPKSWCVMREGDVMDFEFAGPFEADRLSLLSYLTFNWVSVSNIVYEFKLYRSDDGVSWDGGESLSVTGANKCRRASFSAGSSCRYRLEFVKGDSEIKVAELALLDGDERDAFDPAFKNFLVRAAHVKTEDYKDCDPSYDETAAISPEQVYDLSGMMDSDGHLHWEHAPEGEWCIVRFGYTGTGSINSPATAEGEGLECDKMDPEAVAYHFRQFPRKLVDAAGEYVGNTFSFLLIDSWECEYQNWCAAFPEKFLERNGYDIKPWIPVLCGCVVGGAEQTERFVHDYQGTISDLIVDGYYKTIASLCHDAGLELHAEPIYQDINFFLYPPCNSLDASAYCDMLMSEFWADSDPVTREPLYVKSKRPLHTYQMDASLTAGKRLIGAESYTGFATCSETPEALKPFGDRAFCSGINQFILHTSVHQPLDYSPFMVLRTYYGGNYNRNCPWWHYSRGWMDYHARIQYVLQQGESVIDALYYIGDQFPEFIPEGMLSERIGPGFRANSCNYAFLDSIPGRFKSLIIPYGAELEEKTMQKVEELKNRGVEIIHDVYGTPIDLGVLPDFESGFGEEFLFIHKKIGDKDAYFVFNQDENPHAGEFLFRVSGSVPEIWDPETGRIFKPGSYNLTSDGRTSVKLDFKERTSYFVVFVPEGGSSATEIMPCTPVKSMEVAPSSVRMEFTPYYDAAIDPVLAGSVMSLDKFDDPEIKYFSGEVTYTISFDAPSGIGRGRKMALDLGHIGATAMVWLNGRYIGNPWHSGQELPVKALRRRNNELKVVVGTTLRNRMAGDMIQYNKIVHIPGPNQTSLYVRRDSLLQASGISGPVVINVY